MSFYACSIERQRKASWWMSRSREAPSWRIGKSKSPLGNTRIRSWRSPPCYTATTRMSSSISTMNMTLMAGSRRPMSKRSRMPCGWPILIDSSRPLPAAGATTKREPSHDRRIWTLWPATHLGRAVGGAERLRTPSALRDQAWVARSRTARSTCRNRCHFPSSTTQTAAQANSTIALRRTISRPPRLPN